MKNIRKKHLRAMGRSILSFVLITALLLGLIPESAYAAGVTDNREMTEEKDVIEYYGIVSQNNNFQMSCNEAYFNKNLYVGKDFTCSGSVVNVEGTVEASGNINKWCGEFQAADEVEGAEQLVLPDIRSGIESKSDNWEEQQYYMNINGEEVCNGFKKSSAGIQISGTSFIGDCYLLAEDTIQYSVDSLNKDGGRVVLYSENGDIIISGSNIVVNGILAAPHGTVRIYADKVTINGRIYAAGIEMSGTSFNVYSSEEDLELIQDEAEIVKIYDINTDFEEGTADGVTVQEDVLTLADRAYGLEDIEEQYNQECNGVSAKLLLGAGKEGSEGRQIHYNIQLEGKSDSYPSLGEVDAYFRSYNGNLYAFINKQLHWDEAKKFCEDCGGHLATVSSAEEMEVLTEMVRNKSGYTAIGFSDAEKEGEWKWITGEETVYTNWNYGEPNDSFGSGQNHCYIYESGKWDDGYDYIMSPFLCEWEAEENPLLPAGRNIELVVEVNGTVAEAGKWESVDNGEGITTMVYFLDRLMPMDSISLDMDITLPEGEGYQQVIKDSYYIYYDAAGKGHRIEMGDIWVPVKQYTEYGIWKTVYDSEKQGTVWKKLWWETDQAGDSCVKAHVKAYDEEDGTVTEADVENCKELDGIKGRYIEIEVTLQQGQDFRSPVLDKVILTSAKASEDIEVAEQIPVGEILCSDTITAGSRKTGYFKVTGGLEQVSAETVWELVPLKGELSEEDYKIEQTAPYLIHYQIDKPGSYLIKAAIHYGNEEITASKKITVRKAAEIEDIDSLVVDRDIKVVLDMPNYGRTGETISGNIYMPGGEAIKDIRVLQDGIEIQAEQDGSFQAVLPDAEGKVDFDIYLTFEEDEEVYRQNTVYVDSTAPVVRIIPQKETYINGEDGSFNLEIEDESPINIINIFFDDKEIPYSGNNVIELSKLMAGEHALKVLVTDIAGNTAEEICVFKVQEENTGFGNTEPDDTPVTGLNILLDRSSAATGDSIGLKVLVSENMDVSTLKVVSGTTDIALTDGKGVFIAKEAGAYTFTATIQDKDGQEYKAEAVCQVYDTSDKTAPVIKMTAPTQDAVLTDVTDIIGTVTDDKALDYYTLEYAKKGSDEYILITKSDESKSDEVLGKLDTTMMMNGRYTIKLTAKDKGGNSSSLKINVTVEGELKVGAMHIGFTDITAQMGGTTVSANRMYDSRNKAKGDFGIGWTLGVQGMEIYESRTPLSEGYALVKGGSLFSTSYQMTETENHDVVVTYGDGTSDRFELTFSPERKALIPISEVTLGYKCVTNQKVKLEMIGDTSAYVSGTELMFYDDSIEDARSYKLTTEDGVEVYIKAGKGVYKMEDRDGNVITVDKDGYHAEEGRSITFTRDKEGRVIKAEDPAGNVTSYAYDDAGDLVSVTDVADRTVTFTYDRKHNLASITDPMGVAVARNEYDDDGRLVATIDADGNRIEYDYDVEGRTQTVKDRRGNATVYTYDDNGNVLQTVDAYGNKTTNSYDENNNLLSNIDAKGNTTGYTYDASGNVAQVTAADGTKVKSTYTQENLVSSVRMADKTVMALEYDSKGRISSVEDANGNETTYSYTSDGKLTGLTDSIGEYQRVTYDSEGNVASTTNGAGESASYTYDKDGRVTSVTVSREENGETKTFTSHYSYNAAGDITESIDNTGNVTKYEYDDNGRQTASVDAKGRRITYAYDDLGNMVKTTYPDGTFETFTYDANGNNVTATNRNGLTVTMVYDKLDRMTEKQYADGTKKSYVYDEVGNVTEVTGTSGAKTTYTYDERYRNTVITDAYGNVTSFEYDASARLTKRIDAKGNETAYTYDDNGNIIKTTYADGNSVTSEYDARNRVTRQKDQNGNETIYAYDGADRLTGVMDAYGNSYTYGYDGNGNLETVTDAGGHVTRYTYDAAGRVRTVTNALGRTIEYTYDKTGNITQSKDYAGTVTEYAYDDMDRMVKKTVGTETTTFTYDKMGQLVKVTDGGGDISYSYDKYGRLTKQTDVKGNTLSYTYDKAGRLQTFDNGFGKTAYEYDLLDRVTKVIDRNGKITLYEYDELGNRSAVRYPNGNVATYTYDACQRLKEECVTNGNGVQLSKYSYGIGRAGERTSITEVYSGVETEITYKYDKLNRLVKETIGRDRNKLTYEYSYDKVSNRTEKTVSVKGDISALAVVDLEEVQVTEGTTTYTYNALNQLITEASPEGNIIYTYDANGNLIKQTGNKTVDYTYDKENHLTMAAVRQGNSVIIEDYTYDYAGNRTSKTVNGKDTTFYVNNTSGSLTMVAAETDKDGKETAYYTRGEELLSMERKGEVCYYLYDGHGSVRILTNEAGRITDRYSYDAYGNLLEKEGDTENEFLYTGEQYNANTGLYYLRARYMNPSTGTFISMDSYQGSIYDPVSLHKYLYANGNPVMYTDPSGYATDKNLAETAVAATIAVMLASSVAMHNQAMLNIFSSLRKNMADAALSLQCTVTVTDWKNVILGFPAHEFDTKWLITIPMALSSWQLFEAIYATDEDTSNLPGVPAEEQEEKDKVNGVPAEEQSGAKIIQDKYADMSVRPEAAITGSKKHGVHWKEGPARAKKTGKPQGQWAEKDLEYATRMANTLKAGESAIFDLPLNAESVVHMPNGSTKKATKMWIRNNGTGTWHGYPML